MPYTTTTLAQLRGELQEKYEHTPFWTDEEGRLALNEALRQWNLLTGTWKRKIVIPTGANQVWYTLPSSLVYQLRVDFNSYPLVYAKLTDMDDGKPGWEGQTTALVGMPPQPQVWTPSGLLEIGLWPADAVGNNSLAIDGVAATPVLALDTDYVDLSQADQPAILGYALHVLAFKHQARWLATVPLYRQFIHAAVQQNARLLVGAFFTNLLAPGAAPVIKSVEPPPQNAG
jgi:hypothetical protein